MVTVVQKNEDGIGTAIASVVAGTFELSSGWSSMKDGVLIQKYILGNFNMAVLKVVFIHFIN